MTQVTVGGARPGQVVLDCLRKQAEGTMLLGDGLVHCVLDADLCAQGSGCMGIVIPMKNLQSMLCKNCSPSSLIGQ